MASSTPVKYRLINSHNEIESKTEMHDFVSQIPRITYRYGFTPVDGWYSDTGWGCMIRVAQMMIAHTLMRHINHRLGSDPKNRLSCEELMKVVLPLFLDDYSKHEASFSIHNIIGISKTLIDKGAGEWYGAHSISQVIKVVNETYNTQYKHFKILTFNDGIVYKNQINEIFEEHKNNGLLVIMPIRWGLQKLDKWYHKQIKSALSHPLSVGILGGKNIDALYWIGFYNEKLITLDPHTEQDVVTVINDDTIQTYVNRHPRTINISDCDTTMAFCFYLKDSEDASEFYTTIESWKSSEKEEYLISILDQKKELKYDADKEVEYHEDFELLSC